MARRVGFSSEGRGPSEGARTKAPAPDASTPDTSAPDPDRPTTYQATSAVPSGATGRPRRRFAKVILSVFLIPMAGLGIALIYRTMAEGNLMGTAFAMVWTVIVVTILLRSLIAALLGMRPGDR